MTEITIYNVKWAITSSVVQQELWFLCSANRLIVLYISVKFHEKISNGFSLTEPVQFCDEQMDGQIGKKYISPS